MSNGNIDVFVVPPGMGDGIMGSAVALNYRRQFGVPMHIGHCFPELFEGNPDAICHPEYAYYALTPERIVEAKEKGVVLKCLHYCEFQRIDESLPYWRYHYPFVNYIAMMCGKAGLTGEVEILPRIYLTDEERQFGKFYADKQIAIMSTGRDAYKSYPVEKLQQLVDAFPDCHFVQIGAPSDPPLRGVMNLQGKITLRQTAAVLANSHLFVGMVGALMHLARAVDCHSVILCPSSEPGDVFYYPEFCNLQATPGCNRCKEHFISVVSCWQPERCTGDISIENVISAVQAELSLASQSLQYQTIPVVAAPVSGLEDRERRELFQMGPARAYIGPRMWSYLKNHLEQRWIQLDNLNYELIFPVPETIRKSKNYAVIELEKKENFSYIIDSISYLDKKNSPVCVLSEHDLQCQGEIKNCQMFSTAEGRTILHPKKFSDAVKIQLTMPEQDISAIKISFSCIVNAQAEKIIKNPLQKEKYHQLSQCSLNDTSSIIYRWLKNRLSGL